MSRATRHPAEARERAVRLVFEHERESESQWAAISSISSKLGMTAETLRTWVRAAETDQGRRPLYNRLVSEAELTDPLRLGSLAPFLMLPTRRRTMTPPPLIEVVAGCPEGAGVAQWGVAACPDEPWPYGPALPRAVSIGVALAPEAIGPVEAGPTPMYFAEYRRANDVLWETAQRLATAFESHGATAVQRRRSPN